jgi:hypothetical protein
MQKYTDVVTSARSGAAKPDARVTVKTYPGAVIATIYSDDGVTTQDNPITTDSNGEFYFYAADGEYTLTVSGTGITERTIGPIILHDPTDADDYMLATDVSFTPSGSGAISTTAQARIRAGKPLLLDFIPTARLSEIAARTCTTDLTTYINLALAEMTSRGGGTVEASDGSFPWEGTIAVPANVNLAGFGTSHTDSKGTEFLAQNAAAKITFGGIGSANGQRGGKSGGFRVNGNSLATNPFYVGRSVHRIFESIDIEDAAQDNFILQEGQNNLFIGVNCYNAGRRNLVLDLGCGGNVFIKHNNDAAGEYGVYFTQSDTASDSGVYDEPQHNGFFHPIIERAAAGQIVYHGNGIDNYFNHAVFAANTYASAHTLVVMQADGTAFSSRLRLYSPSFVGHQTYTTALSIANGCSVLISGRAKLNALLNAFSIATGSELELEDYAATSVTNVYAGTGSQDTIARKRLRVPTQITRSSASDTGDLLIVSGEAGARFRRTAAGIHVWGDGSDFVGDTNLYRSTANNLKTDDQFQALVLYGQQGTSSTVLPAITTASRQTTAAGNVGTGEDNLMTYAMPANSFSAATKGVRIKAWGTAANNADTKTLRLYFGTTELYEAALTTNQASFWEFEAIVFSTSTGIDLQDSWVNFNQYGTTAVSDAKTVNGMTQDEESAITIKCTGEATSDNDIVQEGLFVEFLN